MSSRDRASAAIFTEITLAADGAFIGLVLAYLSIRGIIDFRSSSSALHKIRGAPAVRISDLRILLSSPDDNNNDNNTSNVGESEATDGKLLVVLGHVEAKSVVDGNWRNLKHNFLVSHESGERGVVLQRTQTVPFILVEGGQWPRTDYVIVNLDDSRHPLPLMTVYHQLPPIRASPYSFLQALFGHEHPIGLLDEEKILSLGKEISAVGICRLQDGTPEIKSDMTKDQMVVDLAFRTKFLLWGGILLGSLSFGILGYAIFRNWNRWKEWRQLRQVHQPADGDAEIERDEDVGDNLDEELCVICLLRRRRSAFLPCRHLVCCQGCSLSVQRGSAPKCPVCRQTIRTSIRIYRT